MSVLREVVAMTTQGFSRSGCLLKPSQLLSGCVCGHDCHAGSSDSEGTGTAPLQMQPRPRVLGGVSPARQWGRGSSSLDASHTGCLLPKREVPLQHPHRPARDSVPLVPSPWLRGPCCSDTRPLSRPLSFHPLSSGLSTLQTWPLLTWLFLLCTLFSSSFLSV